MHTCAHAWRCGGTRKGPGLGALKYVHPAKYCQCHFALRKTCTLEDALGDSFMAAK